MDLVFTEEKSRILRISPEAPLGALVRHHVIMSGLYRTELDTVSKFEARKFNYNKGKFTEMRSFFSVIDWGNELECLSVQECYDKFIGRYNMACETFIPRRRPKVSKSKPWIGKEAKSLLRKKRELWRSIISTKRHENEICKKADKALKESVSIFENDLAGKILSFSTHMSVRGKIQTNR